MSFAFGVVCGVCVATVSAIGGMLLGDWIKRRRLARCTGVAASWCPEHGDCVCPLTEGGWRDMNSDECPLHARESSHAEFAP